MCCMIGELLGKDLYLMSSKNWLGCDSLLDRVNALTSTALDLSSSRCYQEMEQP